MEKCYSFCGEILRKVTLRPMGDRSMKNTSKRFKASYLRKGYSFTKSARAGNHSANSLIYQYPMCLSQVAMIKTRSGNPRGRYTDPD